MTEKPETITKRQCAAFLGESERTTNRRIAAGQIKGVTYVAGANGRGREMRIPTIEAERIAGRAYFDPDAPSAMRDALLPFDAGWIAHFIQERDTDWLIHLAERGIQVPPPPFPEELRATIDGQQVFHRSGVVDLIDNAIGARDRFWLEWLSDPIAQAKHPGRPPIFKLSALPTTLKPNGDHDEEPNEDDY